MIIKPLSKLDTLCVGLFSRCYLGNKSTADGQIPQWTKVRVKVTQLERIPHQVKKAKYNSNRCFRLSQIVMELKILKKSCQAKISNIYSVLVHAALVLGEKYRSVHLPKRRQAQKAIQRYGQKHSARPANQLGMITQELIQSFSRDSLCSPKEESLLAGYENSEVQVAVFSKRNMLREWKLVQRFTFCLSSTQCK